MPRFLILTNGVLALHLVAFLIAITPMMRALEGGDKADPVTEGRLKEEQGKLL